MSHLSSSSRGGSRSGSSSHSSVRVGGGPHHHMHHPHGSGDWDKINWILVPFFSLIIAAGIFVIASCAFHNPEKLTLPEDSKIEIVDNYKNDDGTVGILGDTTELRAVLEDFQEETGITVGIYTVNSSQKYSLTVEREAHYYYLNKSPNDQKHWIFVYCGLEEWASEQGDDTGGILTREIYDNFSDILRDKILANEIYTVNQAFTEAFKEVTPTIMDHTINWGVFVAGAVFVVVPALLMIFVVIRPAILRAKARRNNAQREKTNIDEEEMYVDDTYYDGGQ